MVKFAEKFVGGETWGMDILVHGFLGSKFSSKWVQKNFIIVDLKIFIIWGVYSIGRIYCEFGLYKFKCDEDLVFVLESLI